MNNKLTVKFQSLDQGWYSIFISNDNTFVEIDASDVPIDPVEQLIGALENCFVRGEASEAWMHLEPNYYKWCFTPKDGNVKFELYYIEDIRPMKMPECIEQRETFKLEFLGNLQEVFFPIRVGLEEVVSEENAYKAALSDIESKVNGLYVARHTPTIL